MITALLIGAGALWLLGHKRNGVSGIGATKRKRRIWSEVEAAQRAGIDLNKSKWDDLLIGEQEELMRLALQSEKAGLYKQAKASVEKKEPRAKGYFNQLRRAYKSVAGTNLPYTENIVRNENDDVILIYRDYHMDELPKTAAEWIENEYISKGGDDVYGAYWKTIVDIATGRVKFVWASDGVHRGVQQLVFGQSVPAERKQRISYLASSAKGGQYPEAYAHHLWESVFGMDYTTDHDILNGVLDAIRSCTSVGQAQQMCIDEYLKAHQVEEPLLYQDVPF